jgi:hypothetical protein
MSEPLSSKMPEPKYFQPASGPGPVAKKEKPPEGPKTPAMNLDAMPASAAAVTMPKLAPPPAQSVDYGKWPTPLLEREAKALYAQRAKDPKAFPAANKEHLLKVEAELSKRYAKETAPTLGPVGGAPKVELCKATVDIPGVEYTGLKHHWLRTSQKEVGMGPAGGGVPGVPGANNGSYLGKTTLNDHSGRGDAIGSECTELPDVDEDCVNRELEIGTPTGRWAPGFNDCQVVAKDIIERCTPNKAAIAHNEASDAGVP